MSEKVIIIGGGPAGTAAALSCRKAGFTTTLVEKEIPGGTCVNRGCIPTRIYLEAIRSADYLNDFGMKMTNLFCPEKLREQTVQRIQQMVFGLYYLLEKSGTELLTGEVQTVEPGVIRLADGRTFEWDHCIIATGSKPIIPDMLSWKNRYDAEKLLFSEKLPEELQIAGGGVLGIELAVILKNFGCCVTLFEKAEHILPGWDTDVSISIRSYLQNRGIEVVENSDKTVFDDVVLCCGRTPVLPEILTDDDRCIHILGDAAGGLMTADKARKEGEMIGNMLRRNGTAEPVKVQTRCLFTPLEAAMTGDLLQKNCRESYFGADTAAAGMVFATGGAFAKAVMEKESHILKGFHIVSARASETIQTGALAVAGQMTAEEFLKNLPPHPTDGELLQEAVRRLL